MKMTKPLSSHIMIRVNIASNHIYTECLTDIENMHVKLCNSYFEVVVFLFQKLLQMTNDNDSIALTDMSYVNAWNKQWPII